MSGFKGFLGKCGLVVATSVVAASLAGTGVASAVAAVPNNSVNSPKIINNSVKSADIRNGSVHSIDVTDNNLTGTDILDGSLNGADVADSSLSTFDLQDGTVASEDIADATITSTDIQNGQVSAADLAPTAITRWAKIDADSTGTSVVRGRGVVGATRATEGQYTVTFLQDIDTCGWSATVNHNDFGVAPLLNAVVEQNNENDNNTLRIRVFDDEGDLVDTPTGSGFTVTVDC